ncbi:TIGR04211 family SH3 domain-containing protein [Pseudoalteromonas sp. C2R02]|uniref:TIGR04211 family SH3 domain-containing protein n=1 Tax=Pseudoalteromonas sp. C2R02 TaxID=2841565 RepID=UPI001C09C70C|nr:TIGR04211 family SH3 domain-containing protein [Pseudoalteromonas sp. C2R02]MBU2969437.1 TIGR04211 family SH3 domain-containing protein [Pseudoalteromonas sp. C2R02]
MLKPFIFVIALLSFASHVVAEDNITNTEQTDAKKVYITDSLYIYMHAGAGKNFRILGSVNAGTELDFLEQDDDSGFTKVKDTKGRTGWVDKRYISKIPGLAFKNQELTQIMTIAQNDLREAQIQLPKLQQQSALLLTENTDLKQQIKTLNDKIEQQSNSTQAANEKEKQQLLLYGGGIAFTGLFIGILLTLMLSRRKRSGWA